jgi:hypothetical protein
VCRKIFCKNRLDFTILPDKDKARVDEIDACIATLMNLPPAQPEIVCCKNCKHIRRWRSEEAVQKFGQIYECAYGVFRAPRADDFCSKAERREE